MLEGSVNILLAILPGALVGGAVMIAFCAVGWRAARDPYGWLARCTNLWLDRVVRPLLGRRSWAKRALIIATNNALVCAVLVTVGFWGHLAWLGIAGVGLGLGAGLRLLMESADIDAPEASRGRRRRVLVTIGVVLNLLEPPAILLSVGLSLGQGAIADTLDLAQAARVYLQFALPLLLIAACGEALWMTVCGLRPSGAVLPPGGGPPLRCADPEEPPSDGQPSNPR
jgi:hypothetical protein